jgi:hypothetical protein
MFKRPTENGERKSAKDALGTATLAGVCSGGRVQKPDPHRGSGQKKIPTDKSWDFNIWWSWRQLKDALKSAWMLCFISIEVFPFPGLFPGFTSGSIFTTLRSAGHKYRYATG